MEWEHLLFHVSQSALALRRERSGGPGCVLPPTAPLQRAPPERRRRTHAYLQRRQSHNFGLRRQNHRL